MNKKEQKNVVRYVNDKALIKIEDNMAVHVTEKLSKNKGKKKFHLIFIFLIPKNNSCFGDWLHYL